MNTFDYIAIEGVIGAGKTSLANLLSDRYNAKLALEEFEENPFLPKFYADRDRFAFQTQLSFLASRFHQQQRIFNKDLFHDFIISDYLFDKDRIFAQVNLSGDEMALYDRVFNIMNLKTPKPDLVVFIQCTVDRLMHNIQLRNRDYEQNIDPDYLEELNDAYNNFFYHYDRSPLIVINASEIDFVNNDEHLSYIEKQIFQEPIRNTHVHITPR
ncbi:MAG TPA: deoxynucleoside kinase [Balneolales bacterium]|nr:deoxynucleoside kinase [Balneolales bacterium]